jgi:hypothetical protein
MVDDFFNNSGSVENQHPTRQAAPIINNLTIKVQKTVKSSYEKIS